jgi:hypothetical protein
MVNADVAKTIISSVTHSIQPKEKAACDACGFLSNRERIEQSKVA